MCRTLWSGRALGWGAWRTARGLNVNPAWKCYDAHDASFRATRNRAERERGLRSISVTLANRALCFTTCTRFIAPQTQPNSTGQ
jgi:hypothetical protein